MNEKHKEIESFDDFVAVELKKLKKKYPDTTILHKVSMVSEDEIPIENDGSVDDPVVETEPIDEADSDESIEVVEED